MTEGSRAHATPRDDAARVGPTERTRTRVARCAAIVAAGGAMTLLWAVWWHIGRSTHGGMIPSALAFLLWTYVPCVVLTFVLILAALPMLNRRPAWPAALVCAGVSFAAPLTWSFAYCVFYDDLGYVPTAVFVAVTAWIVTLQPLWVLLLANVLVGQRRLPSPV